MLARTADQLFWMARYVERAENTARMLDVSVPRTARAFSRAAMRHERIDDGFAASLTM